MMVVRPSATADSMSPVAACADILETLELFFLVLAVELEIKVLITLPIRSLDEFKGFLGAIRTFWCVPSQVLDGRCPRALSYRSVDRELRPTSLTSWCCIPGIATTRTSAPLAARTRQKSRASEFVLGHVVTTGARRNHSSVSTGVRGGRAHGRTPHGRRRRARQKVFQSTQPHIVPLLRWRRDLHLPIRRRDHHAVLVQTRRHGVGIQNRSHTLDVGTLRTRLRHIGRARVRRAPVERLRIWMHPEEPLMPRLTVSLPNSLPGILVQEFPNHGLRNRVDHGRISRLLVGIGLGSIFRRLLRRAR